MKSAKKICKNCGICCQRTEMLVSELDIQLIAQTLNLTRNDFIKINELGIPQLKNKDNHCVFLDNTSKLCTIYKIRPKGCKFYPIVYDKDKSICIYDVDCPRIKDFHLEEVDFRQLCKNLKNFIKLELKIKL